MSEPTESSPLAVHRQRVRELAAPGGALASRGPHATVSNPAWFRGDPPQPLFERRRLHARLLAEARAERPAVEQGRRAIVLAGPPGAGKSTVLGTMLGDEADRWLVIDADKFKVGLLREAIRDGSFEEQIKPPAVRELEAGGEKFAPLELASLVHEESSFLAQRLREDAIDQGLNIVVDSVMSNRQAALDMGERLAAGGYDVAVVDVETTYEISATRVEQRWRHVTQAYLGNEAGADLGGRWVPSEYTRSLFPTELQGSSVSESVARELATTCPAVTRYEVHRVTDPSAPPVLESRREGPAAAVGQTRSLTQASFPSAPATGSPARVGETGGRAEGRPAPVQRAPRDAGPSR